MSYITWTVLTLFAKITIKTFHVITLAGCQIQSIRRGPHASPYVKNVTNLRIWQRKTVVLYVHFSFLDILKTFSFFLRRNCKHSMIFFQLDVGKKITLSTCFSLFIRKIISRHLETKSSKKAFTRIRDHELKTVARFKAILLTLLHHKHIAEVWSCWFVRVCLEKRFFWYPSNVT